MGIPACTFFQVIAVLLAGVECAIPHLLFAGPGAAAARRAARGRMPRRGEGLWEAPAGVREARKSPRAARKSPRGAVWEARGSPRAAV